MTNFANQFTLNLNNHLIRFKIFHDYNIFMNIIANYNKGRLNV